MRRQIPSFTLIEVIVVLIIIVILATASILVFRPQTTVLHSQQTQALAELTEIAKAIQAYGLDEGHYPADVSRGLPSGIEKYLTPDESWPDGPIPGTVYDYDNWQNKTCIDNAASGTVQITLRQVPDRNPDGSNVWAWYYVLFGKGTAHCDNASEWNKGECVNCQGFEL